MGGAQWGGSEPLWHAVAKHALLNGDTVFVSIYEWETIHPKIAELIELGAILHLRKRKIGELSFIKRCVRFLKNEKYASADDYINIINFKPSHIFISQSADFDLSLQHKIFYNLIMKHKIPYSFVCHNHSQYSLIPSSDIYPAAIEVFKNAKQVFFISKRQQQLTERKLATRLKNGVFTWNPLNLIAPLEPVKWPTEKIITMAIVGALDGSKGQDTAMEVLSQPQWQNRDWQLNIYGKGQGEVYLKALAQHYNITEKVIFKGYENDILKLWQHNHILLVPSAWDGMPISLVEALICGRPAVVTDIGGMIEILNDGINGFVAASPTVQTFADALETAWLKKSEWQQMGMTAYKLINEKIDLQPEQKIYKMIFEK